MCCRIILPSMYSLYACHFVWRLPGLDTGTATWQLKSQSCLIFGAHSIAGRTQEPMGLQIKWSNEGTALLVGKRFLVSHDDAV